MTVKEIIVKYLKENGFDGLYSDNCGCLVNDLMPCSDYGIDLCEAGVKKDCHNCENIKEPDGSGNICAEDFDFCLGCKKEEEEKT
jgi:hypothetical protein